MTDAIEPVPTVERRERLPWLKLALTYLPIWAAVITGLWGVWTYVQNEQQSGRARLLEAQKPFLDKQLALYFETAEVAGFLSTATPNSNDPEWNRNYSRFHRLYWSELSMVEHLVVERAMVDFRRQLLKFADGPEKPTAENQDALRRAALDLAHAIRAGIQSSWGDPKTNIVAVTP